MPAEPWGRRSGSAVFLRDLRYEKEAECFCSYVGLCLARCSSSHCLALGSVAVSVPRGWGLKRQERKVLSHAEWFRAHQAGHGIFLDQENRRNTSVACARGAAARGILRRAPLFRRPQNLRTPLQVPPSRSPVSPGRSSCMNGAPSALPLPGLRKPLDFSLLPRWLPQRDGAGSAAGTVPADRANADGLSPLAPYQGQHRQR